MVMKRVGFVLLLAALTASAQVRSSSPQHGGRFAAPAGGRGFSAPPARSAAPSWRGGGGFFGDRDHDRNRGVRVGNWTFRTVPSRPGCPGFNCVSYPYYPSYYPSVVVPYYPSYGYSVYDMGQPGVPPPPSNDYIYADNGASQSQSSAGAQASAYDAGYAAGLQTATGTASRYGNHYLDSRENAPAAAPPQPTVWEAPAAKPSQPATRNYTSAAPAAVSPATVLIFKDGHTVEVHNYAIIGQTLWNLSEQMARKIPLADLDLDATAKANDERGVAFKIPGPQK